MKIEFAWIGDGTNVEVRLTEELGGSEVTRSRCYTSDHRGGIHYGEDWGVPFSARQLFARVDESWAPPVISGRYAAHHPYWFEREQRRKFREAAEAEVSDGN